jgi:hypothetical protein
MLCVLVETLGGDSIVARHRFPRQGEVALVYLISSAPDANAGTVTVEEVISLGRLEWPVTVIAPSRALI